MGYNVRIKEFEGPLELLLGLIESKKLSINEISIGSVTEEYFGYINNFKEKKDAVYHREIASFLVIAATLMLIKSRSLLPGFHVTQEEEADIKELEDRLFQYRAIKSMATELKKSIDKRTPLYTRNAYVAVVPSFLPPTKPLDLPRMLALLEHLLQTIPKKQDLPEKTLKKIVSIEERIKELEKRIEDGIVKTFTDFIHDKKQKVDVIVSFLAMLELTKLGTIAARQAIPFDTIHIDHGQRKST